MSELGYHLVLRLGDDRVIAPSRATRRRIASKLADLSRTWPILCWKLADTHLHLLVLASADVVTEIVRRLRIWFTSALALGAPLELQRRKPLSGQSHLEATFHYVLRQDEHHGVETDRLHDASAILDILGLRVLAPEVPVRVREHLPRLGRAALLKHLGVDALDEESHIEHLSDAAAAAFGLESLGADRLSVAARAAAILAANATRVAAADALGIAPNSASRLARMQVPPRHLRAVRLQMALISQKAATEVLFACEPTPTSREAHRATYPRSAGWGGSPRSRVGPRPNSRPRPTRDRGDGGGPSISGRPRPISRPRPTRDRGGSQPLPPPKSGSCFWPRRLRFDDSLCSRSAQTPRRSKRSSAENRRFAR